MFVDDTEKVCVSATETELVSTSLTERESIELFVTVIESVEVSEADAGAESVMELPLVADAVRVMVGSSVGEEDKELVTSLVRERVWDSLGDISSLSEAEYSPENVTDREPDGSCDAEIDIVSDWVCESVVELDGVPMERDDDMLSVSVLVISDVNVAVPVNDSRDWDFGSELEAVIDSKSVTDADTLYRSDTLCVDSCESVLTETDSVNVDCCDRVEVSEVDTCGLSVDDGVTPLSVTVAEKVPVTLSLAEAESVVVGLL